MNHFTTLAVRHSIKHPVQSALLVLGVALGVAMIIAVDLANSSAGQAFALSTDSIAGRATHQIVAAGGDVPVEVYTALRVEMGLRNTAPVVSGLILLPEEGNLPLQLLGVDPFAEAPFRSYFSGASQSLPTQLLSRLLLEPNSIILSESAGERYGLKPGDTLSIFAGNRLQKVTLVGLLQPDNELSRQALNNLALSDISTAQELLGKTGFLSHIDLILPPGSNSQAITNILPQNLRLQRAALRTETLDQMTAAFELNLSALSLLGLVVGMFLIYNTISFSVVQRRRTLGILRCLGVTRREIFGLVLTEALVLSAVGTAIGLGLGILLGRGLVGLVTQTINDLFFRLTVQAVNLQALTLYKGIAAGLGTGLIAASIPALEATTTPPVNALRRSSVESRAGKLLPVLSAVGAIMVVAGAAILQLPTQSVTIGFGALFLILIGISLLTPILSKWLMFILQPLLGKLAGIVGLMAARDITRSFSRTSVTIAALMVSISVIIGVSVMISSFRSTVVSWLNSVLQADVFIIPANEAEGSFIDPDLAQQLANYPGVAEVTAARVGSTLSDELGQVELRAYSVSPLADSRVFMWKQSNLPNTLGADNIVVSEVFARKHGLPTNRPSQISLVTTRDGSRPFNIVGVFYDYASPRGFIAMDLAAYRQLWQDEQITSVSIFTEEDTDAAALVEALQSQFAGPYQLRIASNRNIKDEALKVFDRTFTITAALRLLTTIVAFIGVLSALMSLQLERAKELGTLRANGLTIRQLWGLILAQTALIGLIAGLIAIPTGLILAVILIYVINLRSFGWSLQLILEANILIFALAVALAASITAGIYPSHRMKKMEIASALREE